MTESVKNERRLLSNTIKLIDVMEDVGVMRGK
jgi:hypothetical protein